MRARLRCAAHSRPTCASASSPDTPCDTAYHAAAEDVDGPSGAHVADDLSQALPRERAAVSDGEPRALPRRKVLLRARQVHVVVHAEGRLDDGGVYPVVEVRGELHVRHLY